jgi:hypothetical protein
MAEKLAYAGTLGNMWRMDGPRKRGTKLLVGVDEAGYGPNLGPLVVVAATLEVPESFASASLWNAVRPAVTRFPPPDPSILVIDDSKRVYANGEGMNRLERAVFAWIGLNQTTPKTLREFWQSFCLTPSSDIDESPCFEGQDLPLPFSLPASDLNSVTSELRPVMKQAGAGQAGLVCQIIMPGRFNRLVEQHGSKSTALFQVNAELLRHVWDNGRPSRIETVHDKHGGRNFYRPLLQQEFHETVVMCRREGALASEYVIRTRQRSLEATFAPRAESSHLLVALASMVAKYVRELWMVLFNSYWSALIADLEPTAGYPVDSRRFWGVIEPTVNRLGVRKELLWRNR